MHQISSLTIFTDADAQDVVDTESPIYTFSPSGSFVLLCMQYQEQNLRLAAPAKPKKPEPSKQTAAGTGTVQLKKFC